MIITKKDFDNWRPPEERSLNNTNCTGFVRSVLDSVDCHDVSDSARLTRCATCSDSFDCVDSMYLSHSKTSERCFRSSYLVDCKDVFGCYNLQGKQYCIKNIQLTKEEYEECLPKLLEEFGDMKYIQTHMKGRFFIQ